MADQAGHQGAFGENGHSLMADWAKIGGEMQALWQGWLQQQSAQSGIGDLDPANWLNRSMDWYRDAPFANAEVQKKFWQDGVALWQAMLNPALTSGTDAAALPRQDRRFSDTAWTEQPLYALMHQTYLMLADQMEQLVQSIPEDNPARKQQMRFASQALVDAASPANFAATNPKVLQRAIESGGESLIKGMQNFLADLERGQLTHTDPNAFRLGENIAVTPGKVVHETPLYQLIQYSPATDSVLSVPLIIFPPWINRFYILDLNPAKSFVRWAVEQGITVFMVSWKSADASMAEVVWDDYIRAQIDAIDAVRARLDVPAVHTIGYCVAGTTLAATLAVLARRGAADKVKSATFFTAQVDFSEAGDLLHFIDDQQLAVLDGLSPEGVLDGRYMAATFNLLRGNDLVWSYVVNHYLLGQDYPAFDLLHWNGDVTNLPAKWHQSYLRDLYRDNLLVSSDALSADGTLIDLTQVQTPCFIQAGREDHIAPPASVWKLNDHFVGDLRFLLAGSGHIAGVVNPPKAGKYQYWINDKPAASLTEFIAGAKEYPGSWWPYWAEWLRSQDAAEVPVKGKRKPGGKGDTVIEDAPGRYVRTR